MKYLDSNPKISWALAFESGIRTQATVDLAEMQEAQPKRQKARKGESAERREPVTATQDRVNKGGPGAAYGAEYTPVYSAIRRMERETPLLAAVGHWLCLSNTDAANQYMDCVAEAVEQLVIDSIPNWSDGKVWRAAKKERVSGLIRVALIERRLDMSGEVKRWTPEKIGAVMLGWYGMSINTRDWARDWLPVWALITAVMDRLEDKAMTPIDKVLREVKKAERRAA